MKDDFFEKNSLISHVNKNLNGSHHMNSDTSKYEKIEHYTRSFVKFGNDATNYMCKVKYLLY